MDRGAWRATVRGVAQSRTQLKRLSMLAFLSSIENNLYFSQFIMFLLYSKMIVYTLFFNSIGYYKMLNVVSSVWYTVNPWILFI